MKPPLPERLRICFVSQRLPRTGAAADYGYLWPLARNLATRGFDVHVLTAEDRTSGTGLQIIEGVNIHYLEMPMPGEFATPFQETVLDYFEQLNLEKQFHLVHCADSTGFKIALHRKDFDITVAADIKGMQLDHIFGLLGLTEDTVISYLKTSFAVAIKFLKSFFGADHKFLKNAHGVFVTSKPQKDILELYYFVPSRRIYVIPYGINMRELEPAPHSQNPFERLGVEPGTKIVLTIAPLVQVDEIKNLLTAFQRVVIKKPKTALVIVGEGSKRFELEDHMLNLALGSKVIFTGQVSPEDEDSMITACDIYVNLGSKSSGFEPTVLQAMACRKTVIASEVGTSSNVIQNAIEGFLLRPTDIGALSRLLLELVSGQIDTSTLGARARDKILKMFDTKRMVDETIMAYQQILNSTGKYSK
jgi:1,2-diacylglycerol 3-alpha-glucosyltransferase